MEKFIAVSQEAKDALDARIGATSFRSVNNFINFYNDDLINKRAELVKSLLAELTETYKDIEEKSGTIIFLDPAEIYLSESLAELQPWTLITKIKREVQTAIENGELTAGDTIVFTPQAIGVLCKIVEKEDGKKSFVKVGVEKLFNKADAVEDIFIKYSSTHEGRDGTYSFRAEDFYGLDDSFIQRIHELIPVR